MGLHREKGSDPVPALVFSEVQRRIGLFNHLLGLMDIVAVYGDAEGYGEAAARQRLFIDKTIIINRLADVFGGFDRFFKRQSGLEYDEFFAPVTAHRAVLAAHRVQDTHGLDERNVPLNVAVYVVVGLEMVEVEHNKGKFPSVRARLQEETPELLVEETAVIRLCQFIDQRAAGGVHIFMCVDYFRECDLLFYVGVIVERRHVNADVPAKPLAQDILVLQDLLPVALCLLFGKPYLNERENDIAVVGARLLADRIEQILIVLNMVDNVAAGDLDELFIRQFFKVIDVLDVEL